MSSPRFIDILVVIGIGAVLLFLTVSLYLISKRWNSQLKKKIQRTLEKKTLQDDFRLKNGHNWDFVLVFKVYEDTEMVSPKQQLFNMSQIMTRITNGGLEVSLYYSLLRKYVFCKIRAPLSRLLLEVDRINYLLPADSQKLELLCKEGRKGQWEGLNIPETSYETKIPPYHHIYLEYKHYDYDETTGGSSGNSVDEEKALSDYRKWQQKLYMIYKRWPVYTRADLFNDPAVGSSFKNVLMAASPIKSTPTTAVATSANPTTTATNTSNEVKESILRGTDRLKLIRSILADKSKCGLDMDTLEKDDCFVGFYPLHDIVELSRLERQLFHFIQLPWSIDTNGVKNYFGEKIGLYYVWVSFYTTWLFVAAIVGVFVWINVAVVNDPNAQAIPYFAGFMAAWATLLLEYWKRKEKYTAMEWGMIGFEEQEQTRPAYFGITTPSPIDGKPIVQFPKWLRMVRSCQSFTTVILGSLTTIATIAVIFVIRTVLSKISTNMSAIVSSLILAIEIQFMNNVFRDFAIKLNDYENHRTDTEYEDSLIIKCFLFQFINSYGPLLYIAFMKPYIPDLDPCVGSCMSELQVTVEIIFLSNLLFSNLYEVILPIFKATTRRFAINRIYRASPLYEPLQEDQDTGGSGNNMTEIEETFIKPPYDNLRASFDDYSQTVIQFGYTTLFVAAFPLAPLMSLVCNYVALKIVSWKLIHTYRRPEPKSCEDIGSWYTILEFVSYCAVFINAGIVAYTGNFSTDYTWSERAWIFIMMSAGLIGIKLLMAYVIPDTPTEVSLQMDRQTFIRQKLENSIADDNRKVLDYHVVPSYIIRTYDDDPL